MTEKSYGGDDGVHKTSKEVSKIIKNEFSTPEKKSSIKKKEVENSSPDSANALKAGKVASQVVEFAKLIVKKGVPLYEIAEKIENKIAELGGKPAFPTNLSIDSIAAHYTPSYNDTTLASGLIKVDLGVEIEGMIADTAFSIDLENSEENKKLIEASKLALENAIKIVREGIEISKIGREIQKTIEGVKFAPIINLSGHAMGKYDLHAGISIPNIDNNSTEKLSEGLYAIEPFATSGNGKVYDGKPSGIYAFINDKPTRSPIAREVLELVVEEYKTLPFCSRWLVKKIGTRALIGLKQLEDNGNLHHFPQLIEVSHSKVSQAEHTILVENGKVIVTTK